MPLIGAMPTTGHATLRVNDQVCRFFSINDLDRRLGMLPVCLRIMAEDTLLAAPDRLPAFLSWLDGNGRTDAEVEFRPARVLMHDTTCVPALADLAALRDAVAARGGDPARVNPAIPVDLVIDHSVMVDHQGSPQAYARNLAREFERNRERYSFIKWAEQSLSNFRVVPPGGGIIHQVNLEHLSTVVRRTGDGLLRPDTLVGTDSHTPMVNALGVLGWGVGGIEGLSAALGQPLIVALPEVIGVRLSGRLRPGVNSTDLALDLTQRLRQRGVVGRFLEFFGPGLGSLSVADRATVANMAPEYGATCSFFPIDCRTVDYLRVIGRSKEHVAAMEAYARAQGLWHDEDFAARFTALLEIDLGGVETTVAGPHRPDQRLPLSEVPGSFAERPAPAARLAPAEIGATDVPDGAVLIAAITSCTNTSNPALMLGAGLLARKARAAGLRVPWWVKTSLSPGSRAVTEYLRRAGLQDDLDALGFHLAGYGCMTCIGNSGPLHPRIESAAAAGSVAGAAVLSGNRNFQGRIHPALNAAYLASPPLVVAFALAGSVRVDLACAPLGRNASGQPVYLRDLWPSDAEVQELAARFITPELFHHCSDGIFGGTGQWREIGGAAGLTFPWRDDSTYLRRPPHFEATPEAPAPPADILGARALLVLGDHVTTDHISPAGAIPADSAAGRYLLERGVPVTEFNQYSTRRGNHEVMLRGLFGNPRLRNELAPAGSPAGATRYHSGEILPVLEAAARFARERTPLVIVAGRNYGAGSSRDWAAKGPAFLGVRAVIAQSFERIHRSNLIGMGVLPLQFVDRFDRRALSFDHAGTIDITGLAGGIHPRQTVRVAVRSGEGIERHASLLLRVETRREAEYLRHGGLLPCILRQLLDQTSPN